MSGRDSFFQIAVSAVGIALLIGGCSAHRKPVAAVAKADLAVQQADESAAPRYAELDLKLAREKLAPPPRKRARASR